MSFLAWYLALMYAQGTPEVNGEFFVVEEDGERRPFYALLDVGLKRTTTGARVFGALKGAADGGIEIPHRCVARRFLRRLHNVLCPTPARSASPATMPSPRSSMLVYCVTTSSVSMSLTT